MSYMSVGATFSPFQADGKYYNIVFDKRHDYIKKEYYFSSS